MTHDPRRVLAASAALRDGATNHDACRASGLSYKTVVRIKTSMRLAGQIPPRRPRPERPAPPRLALSEVGQELSRVILRALRAPREAFELSFAAPAALRLAARQSAILGLLMHRAGRVVTRGDIHAHVYDDMRLHEKNLDVQLSRLRVKLAAHDVRITTHPTMGYSLSREDRDRLEALDCAPVALPPLPCMARRISA